MRIISYLIFVIVLLMTALPANARENTTMKQKIGQMLLVGFSGKNHNDQQAQEVLELARDGLIGGVIIFSHNVEDPTQLKNLTGLFQNIATPHPLFIALDQEGGKVQRLKSSNGFRDFKSPKEVAEGVSPKVATEYYRSMARIVKDAGFNVNFAPVVDLHSHPNTTDDTPANTVIGRLGRSFSKDPQTVTEYAQAFIDAFKQEGVLCCLKHYPGHGLAKGDTHEGLVDVTDSYVQQERIPFKKLIQNNNADLVMTAHIINRSLNKTHPATMDPHVLNTWLRDEDGFKGIVISDDMAMGAITRNYGFEEAIIEGVRGGLDIVLMSFNPAALQGPTDSNGKQKSLSISNQVHTAISAIEGNIPPSRIEESYQRIINVKKKLNS
jgi:beta-N-acetylhexosaminidase